MLQAELFEIEAAAGDRAVGNREGPHGVGAISVERAVIGDCGALWRAPRSLGDSSTPYTTGSSAPPQRWSKLERECVKETVDPGAVRRSCTTQVRAALPFGKVAQRDVGLRGYEISVDSCRHQPERMNLEIFVRLATQRHLSDLVINPELSQQEAHLIGVGGISVVVKNDLTHGSAPECLRHILLLSAPGTAG